jgi:hypothetical protein
MAVKKVNRTAHAGFVMKPAQRRELEAEARNLNLTLSAYIRLIIFKEMPAIKGEKGQ